MTIQTIDLRPDLTRLLTESARLERKTIADLINDAVEYFLEMRWREALDREMAAYAAMHADLRLCIPASGWPSMKDGWSIKMLMK